MLLPHPRPFPQLVHTAAVLAARFGNAELFDYLVSARGASAAAPGQCAACLLCDPPEIGGDVATHLSSKRHCWTAQIPALFGAVIGNSKEFVTHALAGGASVETHNEVGGVRV